MLPVKVGEANGAFKAMLFVTVVLKLASSPNAAASSFNVFNAAGEESTKSLTAVSTYVSVAKSDIVTAFIPAKSVNSESIKAPAAVTFTVSVTSAEASILSSFVFNASVKLFCVKPPSPTVYVVLI